MFKTPDARQLSSHTSAKFTLGSNPIRRIRRDIKSKSREVWCVPIKVILENLQARSAMDVRFQCYSLANRWFADATILDIEEFSFSRIHWVIRKASAESKLSPPFPLEITESTEESKRKFSVGRKRTSPIWVDRWKSASVFWRTNISIYLSMLSQDWQWVMKTK